MWNYIVNKWKTESAVVIASVVGLIDAVVVFLVVFGVPIEPEQQAAIVALVTAVLSVTGGFIVRSKVSPTDKT